MAGLVVQSRFAGLKIEDDDAPPRNSQNTKKSNSKSNGAKKTEAPKKPKPTCNKPLVQPAPAPKKRKGKPVAVSDDQWKEWKEKDEELVDGHYAKELQQAILLSKLEYEENKDTSKQPKKAAQAANKLPEQPRAGTKKSKKKNVMSLEQFNDMVDATDDLKNVNHAEPPPEVEKPPVKDTQFFERVKDETKNQLFKEQINNKVKNRLSVSEEVITRVQFADALEKKDKEIGDLRQEILTLKQELLTVKSRNKKLCNILGQGEMKDKAQILVEVERLRAEQAELTAELTILHADLEKERSKHPDPRANRGEKKHPTKKKNIRFDVSSEALLTKEASNGPA